MTLWLLFDYSASQRDCSCSFFYKIFELCCKWQVFVMNAVKTTKRFVVVVVLVTQ